MYDSDKKWIQSQFVPLNYLFDKLKVIEDETKGSRVNTNLIYFIFLTIVLEIFFSWFKDSKIWMFSCSSAECNSGDYCNKLLETAE